MWMFTLLLAGFGKTSNPMWSEKFNTLLPASPGGDIDGLGGHTTVPGIDGINHTQVLLIIELQFNPIQES